MNYRDFGSTGMKVSEMGLGAWQLANVYDWGISDTTDAEAIVTASLDDGVNFFDTAPYYGKGMSETCLGNVLKPYRERVILCTKFGHTEDWQIHYETRSVRKQLEGSLRRLQTDHIDIYLAHNPPVDMMDGNKTDLYDELQKLKEEGKILSYGISLDHADELAVMLETTQCTAAEVFYNAFHQEQGLYFEKAQNQGVGLIVKVPLESGWLTGKYHSNSVFTDNRRRWSPEEIKRRADLVDKLAALLPPGVSLPLAALAFCLAQPQVSTVIPGAKSVTQVHANNAATSLSLPPSVVTSIRELWEKEIKPHPLGW